MDKRKNKTTKKTQQIPTKTAAWLQVYSITMLIVMTLVGCILFDVIEAKDEDRNSNVNSIIEIDSKDELNEITSKQGSYNVMICGKASTYSPIKNDNVGGKLLYVKTITYNDEGNIEEIDKVDFIRIHGLSFSTKTMMFMESNIRTNAIKDGKKIEYQAITSKSEVLIYGRIDNGILKSNAKVYTNITASELKKSMNIESSGLEFFILWETMVLVIVVLTVVYVLVRKSTTVKNYREKVFPKTKEYQTAPRMSKGNTYNSQYDYNNRNRYNSNKQNYKRKEPYKSNNERKR